jgi:hypothetical protein
MIVLALDPGTTKTAFCLWSGATVLQCGHVDNADVLAMIRQHLMAFDVLACEMVASYGMAVGREVFETVFWIGRFIEAADQAGERHRLVYRKDVKLHLCNSPRAKDGNIRQALIDRFGKVGTKKTPGPLFGCRSHIWAALAVGVYACEVRA